MTPLGGMRVRKPFVNGCLTSGLSAEVDELMGIISNKKTAVSLNSTFTFRLVLSSKGYSRCGLPYIKSGTQTNLL